MVGFEPRAFVLLSGGLDSTTCFYLAAKQFNENVVGVSVDYGQRHKRELHYAAKTCEKFNVEHRIINLAAAVPKTLLTDPERLVPRISYDEVHGVSPMYVPFRNGLMLSAIAALAQEYVDNALDEHDKSAPDALKDMPHRFTAEWRSIGAAKVRDLCGIYFGAHAEDARAWAYPDCTPEFIGAMANAIYVGTYFTTRLYTPLQWLDKRQIIMLGKELGVQWRDTWSCYTEQLVHCGVCATCQSRRKGFTEAGIYDPTEYAE